ncbi:MAG TPA: DUF190 domain-containing protein [Acidimicrobiales bacterium]|nr:DUF190 domain-containing protein [Acidimicrobiales bacterium]
MTTAVWLTVIIGRSAQSDHHSAALEVLRLARRAGMAGATVLAGVEGYGSSQRIHTPSLRSGTDAQSYAVVVVDTAEAVDRFLPSVREAVAGRGVVLLEEVEVVSGRIGASRRRP